MYLNVLCFTVAALFADVSSDPYIVGGHDAPEGAYPYMVQMRSDAGKICGGSIISPTVILTAAHCAFGLSPHSLKVYAGSNQLRDKSNSYDVDKTVVHENYDAVQKIHDIALLKLTVPIKYNSKVAPVELETGDVGAGVTATLTGWGRLNYPVNFHPENLQHIQLRTISNSQCSEGLNVHDTQICTLTKKGEGSCLGDSGGPLVANGKQIGVVSWGNECGLGWPDVYTRVSSYIDWIKEHSK